MIILSLNSCFVKYDTCNFKRYKKSAVPEQFFQKIKDNQPDFGKNLKGDQAALPPKMVKGIQFTPEIRGRVFEDDFFNLLHSFRVWFSIVSKGEEVWITVLV